MKKIFVIGNIGSGKSTFCEYLGSALKGLGMLSAVINLDKLGHDALENTEVKKSLKAAFGRLRSRIELAHVAFSDENNLNRLNQITHPYILKDLQLRLSEAEDAGFDWVIVEQTAVKENDDEFLKLADFVICVNSQKIFSETPNRLSAQLSQKQLQNLADLVVENDGDLLTLKGKAQHIAEKVISGGF